jgi:hypothetical protein
VALASSAWVFYGAFRSVSVTLFKPPWS